MICIDAEQLQDGLYNIKNGKIYKYRANGGTARVYKLEDRPQGEWIDMGDFEKCSVCKATHLKEFQSYYGKVAWIKTPYCPQCGARMKGADDEV